MAQKQQEFADIMSHERIWSKTFQFLNIKDLKNVTLVCRAFNSIAKKHMKLVIKLNDLAKADPSWEIPKFTQHQSVLILNGKTKLTKSQIEEIENFGDHKFANLRYQLIENSSIGQFCTSLAIQLHPLRLCDLMSLLNSLVNLEKLKFMSTSPLLPLSSFETQQKIKLSKLKSLKFEDSSEWILDHINTNQLDRLSVTHDAFDDYDSSDFCEKSVVNFINKLTRLDSLTLNDIDWEHCHELKLKFKWKKLTVIFGHQSSNAPTFSSVGRHNLRVLCEGSQADGKAKFEIYSKKFTLDGISTIVSFCKCIKQLHFCADGLPDEAVLKKLCMNGLNGLQSMQIIVDNHLHEHNQRSIQSRLEMFLSRIHSKVKKLSIVGHKAASLLEPETCRNYFSDVSSLTLKKIDEYSENLTFPSLVKLEVEQMKDSDQFNHLKNFSSANPTLKSVDLFWSTRKDYDRRDVFLDKLYNLMNKVQKFNLNFRKPTMKSKDKDVVEPYEHTVAKRDTIEMEWFGKVLTNDERESGEFIIPC